MEDPGLMLDLGVEPHREQAGCRDCGWQRTASRS